MCEFSGIYRTLLDFLAHLRAHGDRNQTADGYAISLRLYARFLSTDHNPRVAAGEADASDPLAATPAVIAAFRHWLAVAYRSPQGRLLARSTQRTKLAAVKSFYTWAVQRDLLSNDPAASVDLPLPEKRRTVHKDHLSLQEATALLDTAGRRVQQHPAGSYARARALRDLALVAYGLASGRRRGGISDLRVDAINWQAGEVRVAWEKGKPGRVLPLADWCLGILRRYLAEARPRFVSERTGDPGWFFLSRTGGQLGNATLGKILRTLVAATCAETPDLVDLPCKQISPHSLRVTFASSLLFANGCPIRSVNELMLHEKLSTTARYTPIDLEDLRRTCLSAHPRA